MKQNELMLRLIRNNTIVGYEWHVKGEVFYSNTNDMKWSNCKIEHDTFEFGIKHGINWFFEGDKVKVSNNYMIQPINGVIKHEMDCGFYVECTIKRDDPPIGIEIRKISWDKFLFDSKTWSLELIGNIHGQTVDPFISTGPLPERFWVAYEDDGGIGCGTPENHIRSCLYYTDDYNTLRAFIDAVEKRKVGRLRPRILRVYTQYFDFHENGDVFELHPPTEKEKNNNVDSE